MEKVFRNEKNTVSNLISVVSITNIVISSHCVSVIRTENGPCFGVICAWFVRICWVIKSIERSLKAKKKSFVCEYDAMNEPTNEYTDNTTITTITQQTNGGKRAHIQRGKEKSAVQKLAVLMLFVVFFWLSTKIDSWFRIAQRRYGQCISVCVCIYLTFSYVIVFIWSFSVCCVLYDTSRGLGLTLAIHTYARSHVHTQYTSIVRIYHNI